MPAYRTAKALPHAGTYTIAEASEILGLSYQAIENRIRDGRIGAYKRHWRYGCIPMKAWFIPKAELRRYLVQSTLEKGLGMRIEWFPPKAKDILQGENDEYNGTESSKRVEDGKEPEAARGESKARREH